MSELSRSVPKRRAVFVAVYFASHWDGGVSASGERQGLPLRPGGYMATFKYRDDALDDEVVIEEHVLPWTAEHPDWLFVHVCLPVFDRTSCCPSYDPSLTGLGGTKRNYLQHPNGLLDRLVGALY